MVGRGREIRELNRLYNRNHADLVAIYGRRGVGKTFLIDETFGKRITFRHVGLSPADQQPEGMLKASEFVEAVQDRQGFYVSCIEEIAWRRGFISAEQLLKLGEELKMTEYGQYLISLVKE